MRLRSKIAVAIMVVVIFSLCKFVYDEYHAAVARESIQMIQNNSN